MNFVQYFKDLFAFSKRYWKEEWALSILCIALTFWIPDFDVTQPIKREVKSFMRNRKTSRGKVE